MQTEESRQKQKQMQKQKQEQRLQWHPAFYADMQIEFSEEAEKLIFENEHQLGTKPKEIDVLIIKKEGTESVQKNIGRIFRGHNVVEYKAPGDYFSVDDYYKVYGYACFYKSDTKVADEIDIRDITITLVSHSYPRKLIGHLQKIRKLEVMRQEKGIYYVKGELIPIQIIITQWLDEKKNLWLRSLTNSLRSWQEADELMESYREHRNEMLYESVMDIIIKANGERFGDGKMCQAMEEILAPRIRAYVANGKAEGREEGRAEGREEGRAEGRIIGALETLVELVQKELLAVKDAAAQAGMSVEEFRKNL